MYVVFTARGFTVILPRPPPFANRPIEKGHTAGPSGLHPWRPEPMAVELPATEDPKQIVGCSAPHIKGANNDLFKM